MRGSVVRSNLVLLTTGRIDFAGTGRRLCQHHDAARAAAVVNREGRQPAAASRAARPRSPPRLSPKPAPGTEIDDHRPTRSPAQASSWRWPRCTSDPATSKRPKRSYQQGPVDGSQPSGRTVGLCAPGRSSKRTSKRPPSYYKKALKKHPKDATVHNDMGLCYHRRGMLDDATKALTTRGRARAAQEAVSRQSGRGVGRAGQDRRRAGAVDHGPRRSGRQLQPGLPAGAEARQCRRRCVTFNERPNSIRRSLPAAHQWIAQLSSPGSSSRLRRGRRGQHGYAPTANPIPAIRQRRDLPHQRSTTPYATRLDRAQARPYRRAVPAEPMLCRRRVRR